MTMTENTVEIHKNRREGSLKRRKSTTSEVVNSASAAEKKLETLTAMVEGVLSDDSQVKLAATTQLREVFSKGSIPLIEDVIESGVVGVLVKLISRDDFPQLQFEAAWALSNIASGTGKHTREVIYDGAIPIFVKLLASPSDDVKEQAVWALGNIVGDSPKWRDLVLAQGAPKPLLALLNEGGGARLSMLRFAAWALSNFCRGKPQPSLSLTKRALPTLLQLIHSRDEEVLKHACWGIAYLAEGKKFRIQAVVDGNPLPRVVELLNHPSPSVAIPALRTIGNIFVTSDMQTQDIVRNQALPCLVNLLTGYVEKSIKEETCWVLSKMTAGNEEQIQMVIDANAIGPLIQVLRGAGIDLKLEAALALSNAISGGSLQQIRYLVSQGCIKALCDLLVCADPALVMVCLHGFANLLEAGEADWDEEEDDVNPYARLAIGVGGELM